MASITKEVEKEFLPFNRMYEDGSVERLVGSHYVPPLPNDPETGVTSKDITISQDPSISARLNLPSLNQTHLPKLPILVYFHGGGLCLESAFSFNHQRYLNSLVAQAQVVAVSVEYRLAPEHLLPIAYEDCWAALQWVALHSLNNGLNKEPCAGANIVHNIAMRVGVESLHGGVKIFGAFLNHPLFWGSKPIGSEAPGGIDNPMINPMSPGALSLAGLGCSRVLVAVAEKDELRDRGVSYYEELRKSTWEGEVELVQGDGDHGFHILHFESENAKHLIKHLASFLLK
ncbi:hypothetical protein RGQ29_024078 [Quercus rubra]|uniref:Alpha/beta hydrolase fold-3 domain-containing protein n=1 Tax=Quercus rubra TaxID=3512 RepID=A0AAN7FA07_QUERU|nr:hypothetical protein RGQ29_024078 [Quercus rubra]